MVGIFRVSFVNAFFLNFEDVPKSKILALERQFSILQVDIDILHGVPFQPEINQTFNPTGQRVTIL